MGFLIARIIAIILLFCAVGSFPYDYYTILRFVVCAVMAYGTWFSIKINRQGWAWCFGIIAALFNPIFPVHLDRETWAITDVGVAIILILSCFNFKGRMDKKLWLTLAITVWGAFVIVLGLIYYVNHYLPRGQFYNTGFEAEDASGHMQEVYKEDLRGLNIPHWAKFFKSSESSLLWIGLLIAGLVISGNKHKTKHKNGNEGDTN